MKIRSVIIIASAVFGLAQLTRAQCPEICDSSQNTGLGQSALLNNTGIRNTALGSETLRNNNGEGNTATGYQALLSNRSGTFNTAAGEQALFSNTTANENTAFGAFALALNITGSDNTGLGYQALSRNTSSQNTAVGWNALWQNTTGGNNTALGYSALSANTGGSDNIALGNSAGSNLTFGNNNIDIGASGVSRESDTIRIGTRGVQRATFIAGISGTTVGGGVGVLIDSNGRLGTNTSSARYKQNIQPMDKASEAILSLQPVTFSYKKELDPAGIPQFGLVAEQVQKVNPDLVARDEQGKPYTVRYEAVNAMLLNEFIKEHRTVQEQKTTIRQLQSGLAQQQKEIDALKGALNEQAAQIQQVSDRLAASQSTPWLVAKE